MKKNGNIFISLVFLTVIAAATADVGGAKDEIFLQKSAALKAGPIRLADVAEVKADQELKKRLDRLIVANISAGDEDVLVGNFEICRALAQAQINPATVDIFGASHCRVINKNASQLQEAKTPPTENKVTDSVKGADTSGQITIADVLTRTVAELSGFEVSRLKVDWRCNRSSFLQQPAENNRYKIIPRTAATLGNVSFDVLDNHRAKSQLDAEKSSLAGKRPATVTINGYVQLLCESVMALRRLQAGEMITAADVKIMSRRVGSYRNLGIKDINLVIGQEAARTIAPQTVIFPEMIRKLQLVKRDQDVKVRSKVGQVQVTLRGRAMAAGGLGDEITVRCGNNKTTVRATITGLGEVTIGGEPTVERRDRSSSMDMVDNKMGLLSEK